MSLSVRLTHIDGALPNLALMKMSHFFKEQRHSVYLTKDVERGLFEPEYDAVYGSVIFSFSRPLVERFLTAFPGAVIGGTGTWAKALPMVYNNADKGLKRFQRWVVRRYYEFVPWEEYQKTPEKDLPLLGRLAS